MPEPPLPDAPARPLDGHKGTFGTVIVVGGCATMPGAPAICAGAALRAGAGLVKLATDSATLLAALSIEPSATGLILDGADSIDGADAKGDAVLAIGPGFGDAHDVDRLVLDLLGGNRRIVLDADGLNALARFGKPRPGGATAVLTPHPGEFRRLADAAGVDPDGTTPEARPANGAALARHHRAVVVLKGRQTVITDGQRTALNKTGNPAEARELRERGRQGVDLLGAELHHHRRDGRRLVLVLGRSAGAPGVRQARAQQHEVAGAEGLDARADHALPAAALDPRQLHLRVAVPGRVEARGLEALDHHGPPRPRLHVLALGLHGVSIACSRGGGARQRRFSTLFRGPPPRISPPRPPY